MVLARLPNIDMYGKAWNGASYYKEIKQLKITDAICESDKEYVDDAIFDLIAGKTNIAIFSPSFVNLNLAYSN